MREELEEIERYSESDLEELFSRPVSERYTDVSKELLEGELNNIKLCLETIGRIVTLVSSYYDSVSNELVNRENDREHD